MARQKQDIEPGDNLQKKLAGLKKAFRSKSYYRKVGDYSELSVLFLK